jgi:hypothetical protein
MVNEVLGEKEIKDKLALQGMTAFVGPADVLGTAVEREVQLWKDLAKTANMKLAD